MRRLTNNSKKTEVTTFYGKEENNGLETVTILIQMMADSNSVIHMRTVLELFVVTKLGSCTYCRSGEFIFTAVAAVSQTGFGLL